MFSKIALFVCFYCQLVWFNTTSSLFAGYNGPLLSTVTHYNIVTNTFTVTKATPCYMTTGWNVSKCRRRRGIEEKPLIIVDPTPTFRLESTTKEQLEGSERQIWLDSSIVDDVDDKSGKMPRGSMDFGRQISISVGCVNSTFNFSQFLEFCLGLTVQETTTLTATFSETITHSTGYATLTVGGCTPSGFPYSECRDFFITFPPLPMEPSTPQPGTQPYMNE